MASFPKRAYVRSKKVTEACRQIACQHCGLDEYGQVVAAHSNWSSHGKGAHIKADDSRVAALCFNCHVPLLDQGSKLSKAERQSLWWKAHCRTIKELVRRHLWPKDIDPPDIDHCPFDLAAS